MSDSVIINAQEVSKSFKLYDTPLHRLKEALNPFSKRYHKPFFAVKGVSFSVRKGETLGVVGKNGSGKSTLLKLVTGILQPTSGALSVRGRVSALLELGTGFNPELNGIQNIFLHGTIMGSSPEEIQSRVEHIIQFADIGDFINQPVKTYSSGMFVRLAFAVATSIEPEVLIVDEALAVGDMFFQAKSSRKMRSLIEEHGTTLLFVSHEMSSVKSLCSRALYLRDGELIADGESGKVCDTYVKDQRERLGLLKSDVSVVESSPSSDHDAFRPFTAADAARFASQAAEFRQGAGDVRIEFAELVDSSNSDISLSFFGQPMNVRVYFRSKRDLPGLVVGCYLRDTNQLEITGSNTVYEGSPIGNVKAGQLHCCEFQLTNYLKAGTYSIKLLLVDNLPTTQFFDVIDNAIVFRSADLPGQPRWALMSPPILVRHYCLSERDTAA